MGRTKSALFSSTENHLAQFSKALGHPARVAILRLLLKRNRCICGDLVSELPLAQSTISQHLKALQQSGLIRGEVSGPATCYCIDLKNWQLLRKMLKRFLDQPAGGNNFCC
ncbi:MAG: winged helix-turn-helix transcriptional regulator [Saprospiraceae bacterium]|jgi:ArsR family transcriptional regulator|nr:winged helix-turn-helix transcriptional regulator [Saprospiraceae bacterium]MBP9210635.1 winged helix-turn-helix transcriptional regulator [Saprospiraceae bacterium]MBV6473869.1 putative HTH-type transcriptional regulator [Saprospiraceae bacterium]